MPVPIGRARWSAPTSSRHATAWQVRLLDDLRTAHLLAAATSLSWELLAQRSRLGTRATSSN
jgi:hypothetical protein